jgi:hypothetical protein
MVEEPYAELMREDEEDQKWRSEGDSPWEEE